MLSLYIKITILSLVLMFVSVVTRPIGIFLLFLLIIVFVKYYLEYSKSCYKKICKNSALKVFFDIGLRGEYLTVKAVEGISEKEKILVNVYLDKSKNDTETTEVDVIYINKYGIFVLESKNFSGWIYGDDKSRTWTQTLNRRTKYSFYNPVWQNSGHISAIVKLLGSEYTGSCRNIVVFSERCSLKKINIKMPDAYVINRNNLRRTISSMKGCQVLTDEQIESIAGTLSNYANADKSKKIKHIEAINVQKTQKMRKNPEPQYTQGTEEIQDPPKILKTQIVSEVLLTNVVDNSDNLDKNELVCSKCGAKMLLRKATRGKNLGNEFWGCSNFPKCRSIIEK